MRSKEISLEATSPILAVVTQLDDDWGMEKRRHVKGKGHFICFLRYPLVRKHCRGFVLYVTHLPLTSHTPFAVWPVE